MKESTYLKIKALLDQWYGLTNDRANLQVLVQIASWVNEDIKEAEKPKMTKEEFEAGYCALSGITLETLHEWGRQAAPCNCGEPICQGWQMLHGDQVYKGVDHGTD